MLKIQDVDTRISNVVTHIYATASFGLQMRIEKVRGNRVSE